MLLMMSYAFSMQIAAGERRRHLSLIEMQMQEIGNWQLATGGHCGQKITLSKQFQNESKTNSKHDQMLTKSEIADVGSMHHVSICICSCICICISICGFGFCLLSVRQLSNSPAIRNSQSTIHKSRYRCPLDVIRTKKSSKKMQRKFSVRLKCIWRILIPIKEALTQALKDVYQSVMRSHLSAAL